MLCLSRKPTQRLILTQPGQKPIVVEVLKVQGHKVCLGIGADREVVVVRGELKKEAA